MSSADNTYHNLYSININSSLNLAPEVFSRYNKTSVPGHAAARKQEMGNRKWQMKQRTQNLKAQILQVAGRMFLEYGYSGTTFQKIADELNITKGSITYHFKTNS